LGITHAALTFFYGFSCPKEMPFLKIFRNRKDKTLPVIVSREEVRRALAQVKDMRYRACLTLIYSCGLRISEAVKIEVSDIDSKQGLLHIHQGKGAKDRLAPLPERTLQILREMWQKHRHPKWLFPAYRFDSWRKPPHYFSETDNFSHFKFPLKSVSY